VDEIHPINAGDRGRNCENGRPCRQPAGDCGLLRLAGHEACFEGKRKHFAQCIDLFLDTTDVIAHVAKERLHRRIDRQNVGVLQPLTDFGQRQHGVSQP